MKFLKINSLLILLTYCLQLNAQNHTFYKSEINGWDEGEDPKKTVFLLKLCLLKHANGL